MEKLPRHRPKRQFPDAKRLIFDCELNECIHCDSPLVPRKPWHMSKTVQTMNGPLFVAGKSKECVNPNCYHTGQHYYASGVLLMSLPYSTYGLDILAFIGWQHEHEHKQLVEIQQALNQRRRHAGQRTSLLTVALPRLRKLPITSQPNKPVGFRSCDASKREIAISITE